MNYVLVILLFYSTPFAIQIPMENKFICEDSKRQMVLETKKMAGRYVIECLKVK